MGNDIMHESSMLSMKRRFAIREILPPMPVIDPLELIGRTFLMDKEDGQ
jgi:hypothetical protein